MNAFRLRSMVLMGFLVFAFSLYGQDKKAANIFDIDELETALGSNVTALNKDINLNVELEKAVLNVNVTDNATAQNEAAIAVDPTNTNHIAIAMNDYGVGLDGKSGQSVAYSLDGGATWQVQRTPTIAADVTGVDPAIAYSNGVLYVAYVGMRYVNKFPAGSGIFITRSLDNGATWSVPVAVVSDLDNANVMHTRPALAADPVDGSIAVAWVKNEGSLGNVTAMVARSADGVNFGSAVAVNAASARVKTAVPAFNGNHELFVAWFDVVASSACVSKVSGANSVLLTTAAVTPIGQKTGNNYVIKNSLRVNSYPVMAIDNSAKRTKGNIYVAWADQRSGNPDVVIITSKDNGSTWSSPARIHNDNTAADQFFPSIHADPVSGTLNVLYYDSRNDANNMLVDAYVSQSVDGGKTFVDQRISTESSDPRVGPFGGAVLGDYIAVSSYNNQFFAAWTDTRKGNDQDVYFAKNNPSGASVNPGNVSLDQNYPNPFNPVTKITYTLSKDAKVVLKIYNSLGQEVNTLVNDVQNAGVHSMHFDASALPSGVYFYRLTAGNQVSVKKMMLVK